MSFDIEKIYQRRWHGKSQTYQNLNREIVWKILVKSYFQKFFQKDLTTLDLGCGMGHFINNIEAKKKIAVDMDLNCKKSLNANVEFHHTSADNLKNIPDNSINFVFSSNLLEHLESNKILFSSLHEIRRVLKNDHSSTLTILMPNIKKIGMKFYDYIDHRLVLTPKSLIEALEICGFDILIMWPGFLPYSIGKSRFRIPRFLIYIYLKIPLRNRPFSGQMLLVATPSISPLGEK